MHHKTQLSQQKQQEQQKPQRKQQQQQQQQQQKKKRWIHCRWIVAWMFLAAYVATHVSLVAHFCRILRHEEERNEHINKNEIQESMRQTKDMNNRINGSFQRTEQSRDLLPATSSIDDDIHEMSSVDYMACCGLGHRMSKLADASYVATRFLQWALRSFWGYCDTVEVFHHLFGPQPPQEVQNVASFFQYARINNDVPDFVKLIRKGPNHETACPCSMDKAAADVEFYASLRNRFRRADAVHEYWKELSHNDTKLVIGVHIRAGNGEDGDFSDRGRGITDLDGWLTNLAQRMLEQHDWYGGKQVVVFLATDTPSIIEKLQLLLKDKIDVRHLPQERVSHGSGVLFGERGKVATSGDRCLRGWEYAVMDMILLSMTDIVVAARPSSFTQSMPMSLVFDKRSVEYPYCEVNPDASSMRCYQSFREWCCQGETNFILNGIQSYDYLRMPPAKFNRLKYKINSRGFASEHRCQPRPPGHKLACLPYNWSEYKVAKDSVTPLVGY